MTGAMVAYYVPCFLALEPLGDAAAGLGPALPRVILAIAVQALLAWAVVTSREGSPGARERR